MENHRKQLEAFEKVLSKAPPGRDVGSAIERVLRFCISSKHDHITRALPPSISEPLLRKCQEMTLDFIESLHNWSSINFWNAAHRKLVRWNLELPLKEGGTGCLPHWMLAKAAYVASWYQPLSTIAQASNRTEIEILQDWNNCETLPSIKLVNES